MSQGNAVDNSLDKSLLTHVPQLGTVESRRMQWKLKSPEFGKVVSSVIAIVAAAAYQAAVDLIVDPQ